MLHAVLVRSPHPHAAVLAIDAAAASAQAGVVDVLTSAGLPAALCYGTIRADRPVLAAGVVRHVGEPVAAVLAHDPRGARRAADLVRVDYRVLAEIPRLQGAAHDPLHPDGNILRRVQIRRGQIRSAAHLVDGEFGWVPAGPGAPEAVAGEHPGAPAVDVVVATVVPTGDGVVVRAAGRWGANEREQLAQCLGVAPDLLAFEGQGRSDRGAPEVGAAAIAAVLALRHNRPVSLHVEPGPGPGAPAISLRYRHHADVEGTLSGVEADIAIDVGAYAGMAGALVPEICAVAAGPYRAGALAVTVTALRSTSPPAEPAPGEVLGRVTAAVEAQLDELAATLAPGLPLTAVAARDAVRRHNLLGLDDPLPTGQRPLVESPIPLLLEELEQVDAPPCPGPARGGVDVQWRRGTAVGMVPCGLGEGADTVVEADVVLSGAGVLVRCAAAEADPDLVDAACSLAADVLGLPASFAPAGTPAPGGSPAAVGGAVLAAIEDLTAPARARMGAEVGIAPALVVSAQGQLRSYDGVFTRPLVPALSGDEPSGRGWFRPAAEALDENGQGEAFLGFAYAAARVLVGVVDGGPVRVAGVQLALDCGRVADRDRTRAAALASARTGIRIALPAATVDEDAITVVHLAAGERPMGVSGVAAGAVAAALAQACRCASQPSLALDLRAAAQRDWAR